MDGQKIHYHLEFEDKPTIDLDIILNPITLQIREPQPKPNPSDWTRLEVEKCSCCPLKESESPRCPLALRIETLIDIVKNEISHTRVKVTVKTAERDYYKEVALQEVLGSIFGLIMATSGCPIMSYLKPMAKFHLPFASLEESIVRSVSMHLLRQYYRALNDEEVSFDLEDLDHKYEDIQKVNLGLNKRIQKLIKSGDASHNSVAAFHAVSKLLSMNIQRNLQNYKYLFES